MATGKMYEAEVQRFFTGKPTKVWVKRPVSQIEDREAIRCCHCHGEVRIHRQRVDDGPKDHVEHRLSSDSKNCQGGHGFKAGSGQGHQMSASPIT